MFVSTRFRPTAEPLVLAASAPGVLAQVPSPRSQVTPRGTLVSALHPETHRTLGPWTVCLETVSGGFHGRRRVGRQVELGRPTRYLLILAQFPIHNERGNLRTSIHLGVCLHYKPRVISRVSDPGRAVFGASDRRCKWAPCGDPGLCSAVGTIWFRLEYIDQNHQ